MSENYDDKMNNSTTYFSTITERQINDDNQMFLFGVAIMIKHFMVKGEDDGLENRRFITYVYFMSDNFHINRESFAIQIHHILIPLFR